MPNSLLDWIFGLMAAALVAGPAEPPTGRDPTSRSIPGPNVTAETAAVCRLVVAGEGSNRRLIATATAGDKPFSGSYELSVRSAGNVVRHGGDVAADAGQTVALGTLRLSGTAAGSIDARLDVLWNGGRSSCRGS